MNLNERVEKIRKERADKKRAAIIKVVITVVALFLMRQACLFLSSLGKQVVISLRQHAIFFWQTHDPLLSFAIIGLVATFFLFFIFYLLKFIIRFLVLFFSGLHDYLFTKRAEREKLFQIMKKKNKEVAIEKEEEKKKKDERDTRHQEYLRHCRKKEFFLFLRRNYPYLLACIAFIVLFFAYRNVSIGEITHGLATDPVKGAYWGMWFFINKPLISLLTWFLTLVPATIWAMHHMRK